MSGITPAAAAAAMDRAETVRAAAASARAAMQRAEIAAAEIARRPYSWREGDALARLCAAQAAAAHHTSRLTLIAALEAQDRLAEAAREDAE